MQDLLERFSRYPQFLRAAHLSIYGLQRLPAFPEVDIHSPATRDGWPTAQAPWQQRAHRVGNISPVRDNSTGLQLSQTFSPMCGKTCESPRV